MERSPQLQELVGAWFDAFSRGDGAWISRHISRDDDVRLIGTDPANWVEGERVAPFLADVVNELAGAVEIVPRDVLALREGSIGWGVMRATLRLPGGNEVGFRWSAVFRQEDGEWKAVQIHGSIGVRDEEAFAGESPG
jgi:ketosteroid isomerase-like protein